MRRFLVGLAFTAASVALLARVIDWSTTAAVLEHADFKFIALAVTCLVLSLAAKTARWRLLLPSSSAVTTPRLYRILHISFLLNNVLPARLGDVARIALTSKQPGIRFGHVLSSLLTERLTDAVTLITCFVLVSPFLPIPDAYLPWLHTAWVAVATLFVLAVLVTVLRRPLGRMGGRLASNRHVRGNRRLRDEATSFREGWRQLFSRKHVLRIWGWSGMAWIGAFAINYMLMQALRIDAPMAVAVLLTCTTNLSMLLPSSPGYVGVFHAAATLSLLPFGVGSSEALGFAILAHLVNVLPVSLLGAAFLLLGHESINLRLSLRAAPASETAGDEGEALAAAVPGHGQ
jgi:uncharacterized protein (TIRG00374 family)